VLGLGLLIILTPIKLIATFQGLLAAHLIVTLPYVIRTTATALSTLLPEYEEAAPSLGATPWRVFWRVTLPLVRPGIISGAALAFIVSFDELVLTLFLVGPRITTLPVAIYHYVEYRTDPSVAALSVIFIAISVLIVLVIERVTGVRRVLQQ
jgi:putative spermidine/putrescine transport system permease protein